ncbi:Lsr2 family protein [Nocardioides psychrotolerans]|uniref:histone-like nucleoid-structuring protein Lsr2 n=1 Tax=Nocardioides psychrotolerans TaxID=1005945 RepID=UPI0031381B32
MAKKTVTHITDDLDGSKDATEVAFSFDGVDYTIDLSKKNTAAMAKALKPYLDAATKVSGRGTRSRRTRSTRAVGPRRDLAAIRKWARDQSIDVSDRGRIPAAVIEQYDAVH